MEAEEKILYPAANQMYPNLFTLIKAKENPDLNELTLKSMKMLRKFFMEAPINNEINKNFIQKSKRIKEKNIIQT